MSTPDAVIRIVGVAGAGYILYNVTTVIVDAVLKIGICVGVACFVHPPWKQTLVDNVTQNAFFRKTYKLFFD